MYADIRSVPITDLVPRNVSKVGLHDAATRHAQVQLVSLRTHQTTQC